MTYFSNSQCGIIGEAELIPPIYEFNVVLPELCEGAETL